MSKHNDLALIANASKLVAAMKLGGLTFDETMDIITSETRRVVCDDSVPEAVKTEAKYLSGLLISAAMIQYKLLDATNN